MLASSEKNNDVICLKYEVTTVAAERGKHTTEQKLDNPDGQRGSISEAAQGGGLDQGGCGKGVEKWSDADWSYR